MMPDRDGGPESAIKIREYTTLAVDLREDLTTRPRVREAVTKDELDRILWIEVARHLSAIAAALQRRYTEATEIKGGPRH